MEPNSGPWPGLRSHPADSKMRPGPSFQAAGPNCNPGLQRFGCAVTRLPRNADGAATPPATGAGSAPGGPGSAREKRPAEPSNSTGNYSSGSSSRPERPRRTHVTERGVARSHVTVPGGAWRPRRACAARRALKFKFERPPTPERDGPDAGFLGAAADTPSLTPLLRFNRNRLLPSDLPRWTRLRR